MQILIASDIHANFSALLKAENDIKQSDYIFFLGDFIGYNPDVNEVIDYIKRLKNCCCLMGNHDYCLVNIITDNLNPQVLKWIEFAKENIRPDNLDWLKTLPVQLSPTINNKRFLLQHGSPNNPVFEYIYPDYDNFDSFFMLDYDIICIGHTHRFLLKKQNNKIILNPGSIGQPRDDRKNISYCILHEDNRIEHRKLPIF